MNAPEPTSPYDRPLPDPFQAPSEPEAAEPPTAAPEPSSAASVPVPPPAPVMTAAPRPGVRLRTVVFGLLLGLLALVMVVARATSVEVDGMAVAIGALIVAGVLMLVGSLTAVARERRGG